MGNRGGGGTITIPDIRDRYPRVVGSHGKNGTLLGDAIRSISGSIKFRVRRDNPETTITGIIVGSSGSLYYQQVEDGTRAWFHSEYVPGDAGAQYLNIQSSRTVPTADENRPTTFMSNCYIKAGNTLAQRKMIDFITDHTYPIGSIYITTSDSLNPDDVQKTNPNNLFGGEWEIWEEASGRVLVGVDRDDPQIAYTSMKTGKKLHTLLEKELPKHQHEIGIPQPQWPAIAKNQALSGYELASQQVVPGKTQPIGENVPFSLMQPSISVIFWKRVG